MTQALATGREVWPWRSETEIILQHTQSFTDSIEIGIEQTGKIGQIHGTVLSLCPVVILAGDNGYDQVLDRRRPIKKPGREAPNFAIPQNRSVKCRLPSLA